MWLWLLNGLCVLLSQRVSFCGGEEGEEGGGGQGGGGGGGCGGIREMEHKGQVEISVVSV